MDIILSVNHFLKQDSSFGDTAGTDTTETESFAHILQNQIAAPFVSDELVEYTPLFQDTSDVQKKLFEMELNTSFSPNGRLNPVSKPANLVGLKDFCSSMAERNNNYSAAYLDKLIKNYMNKFLYR